jgi:hypothetical protein
MTQDEKRIAAVMNMMGNAATLLTATMSSALGEAVGGAFAGIGEALGAALGDGEAAQKRGKEVRKEVSEEIAGKMRDLVTQTHKEMLEKMGETVSALPPGKKKELGKELQSEPYERALEAVKKTDFGLPPLSESLSDDDLLKYLQKIQDPRLGELIQQVLALPEPKALGIEHAAPAPAAIEPPAEKPAGKPPKKVPAKITALPATYRFPPGAKTKIVLAGDKPLWIKWDAKLRPGETCENYGIEGQDAGGGSASTPCGGTVFHPENGILSGTLTNKESFAIVVEIVTEPYDE